VNTCAPLALRAGNLAKLRAKPSVCPAMGSFKIAAVVVSAFSCCLLGGCMQSHEAKVQSALLPPPSATPVQHTGRLWVELGNDTWENQCRTPKGQRMLCFDGVRRATFGALSRSLWTSFPDVALRDGDALSPGDYVLTLDITLNAQAPDAEGPGWSALAAGGFRLTRDGKVLHEERLGSRSRPAFAYGSALGVGAGEVVDALAVHVAEVLGAVAEERPLHAAPLPAVVAEVLTPAATAPAPAAAAPTPPFEVVPMTPDAAPAPAAAVEPAPPAAAPATEPPVATR